MKTITAKEAKNRLGRAIDTTLAEGALMITKNGRESVVLLSAEKYRELIGVQGFIKDEFAAAKDQRRREFSARVRQGQEKATDASMFHGAGATAKVRYRSDDY
jgi:prevent-host-death family protein